MASSSARSAGSRFGRLLLAVELPESSGLPEARALALAVAFQASVVIISVLESRAHLPVAPGRVDQLRATHERAGRELARRAREMGIDVECLIWQGDPADSIIEAAGSELADLIVIGLQTRIGSDGQPARGVSDEVVRRAAVPVLVVPEPARIASLPT